LDKYTLKGFTMKSQKRKTRNQGTASKAMRRSPIKGVVISRKCSSCGHHEIVIITRAGKFLALKPGMKIAVLQDEKED
jgi:ribosomal protein L44E